MREQKHEREQFQWGVHAGWSTGGYYLRPQLPWRIETCWNCTSNSCIGVDEISRHPLKNSEEDHTATCGEQRGDP